MGYLIFLVFYQKSRITQDEFFDEIIEFAIKYNILIVQDAPYATLVFNENSKAGSSNLGSCVRVTIAVF